MLFILMFEVNVNERPAPFYGQPTVQLKSFMLLFLELKSRSPKRAVLYLRLHKKLIDIS